MIDPLQVFNNSSVRCNNVLFLLCCPFYIFLKNYVTVFYDSISYLFFSVSVTVCIFMLWLLFLFLLALLSVLLISLF